MADEPIIQPYQFEPRVLETLATAEHPAPSREQEQLADGVFSREADSALAAVLNLQAGIVLMHHLARETFEEDDEEEEPKPRPRPEGARQ